MFLIFLIFLAALSIEVIGAYISVLGLAAAFASDPIILTMSVILDFCKVIAVSTLAKRWNYIDKARKGFLVASTVILMIITSSGVAGYLSNSFQKAMIPNQGNSIVLQNDLQERDRLQARKKEIDVQISQLPATNVRGRQKLITSFKPETDHINQRLNEIDAEIPKLQTTEVQQNTEVVPVMFMSKALNMPPEHAVLIIIGMIVFVFDPMAIVFLITGNDLLNKRRKIQADEKAQAQIIDQELAESEPTPQVEDEPKAEGPMIITNLAPPDEFPVTREYVEQQIAPTVPDAIPVTTVSIPKLTRAEYRAPTKPKKFVQAFGPKSVTTINKVPVNTEVEVIKEVQVPVETIKEVEVVKEVPVPVEVIKEVVKEVPVEVIKEVPVEVIKEVPVQVDDADRLDKVLKEIFEHDGAGKQLTDEERNRLNKALDRIFPPTEKLEPLRHPEADPVQVQVVEDVTFQTVLPEEPTPAIEDEQALKDLTHTEIAQEVELSPESTVTIPSSLNDPTLDQIRGSNGYFVGENFADKNIVKLYKD